MQVLGQLESCKGGQTGVLVCGLHFLLSLSCSYWGLFLGVWCHSGRFWCLMKLLDLWYVSWFHLFGSLLSAQLGPGLDRPGWGFDMLIVGVVPIVCDNRAFGVSVGVGADGFPLFLLPDSISWRGDFLGVPSFAVVFAWVLFLAVALSRFVPQGFGSIAVDGLGPNLVWFRLLVPWWFCFALNRYDDINVVGLGFSFRQLEWFDVGQLLLG